MYKYSDGEKYEGFFKDGIREGFGQYYYNNGDKYEGEFKNGIKEGKGKIFFANGDRFEAEFINNIREGLGKIYQANGKMFEIMFIDDEPVEEIDPKKNLVSKAGNDNNEKKKVFNEVKKIKKKTDLNDAKGYKKNILGKINYSVNKKKKTNLRTEDEKKKNGKDKKSTKANERKHEGKEMALRNTKFNNLKSIKNYSVGKKNIIP